ncbi:GTPase subunit of restriction endonuclease [Sphaerimonospora thailandensis]|uniref:GTPase subunit of restriction endonuclease n=2 Tax=Sphaerimonospora thailandensis TaxID=795644 RepID=A0A8J3VY93_9ACTN|nr:GTPase subunit of restriction endonuclease [Sphaerimonospora thailandensis]
MLFTAAQVLAERPEGVPTRELWLLVRDRLPGLEEEWKPGGVASNTPEIALGYKSGGLVKSGWVVKAQGRWRLTPLGRIALGEHPHVSPFMAAAHAAYQYWEQHRTGFEMAKQLLEAVPEGSWVAARDLAVETGLDEMRLVQWLQGERPEGWHRVLDGDGGVPDAVRADEELQERWYRLLEKDGLSFVTGRASLTRRISGADLRQLMLDNPDSRTRRAWLVRGLGMYGGSLLRDWLTEGFCSLPASKLPELPPGSPLDAIRAAVEEDYAHGSFNEKLKKTNEFYAFLTRMRDGDLVLCNDGGKIYIGRLRGEPAFRASVENRANLQRPVSWLNGDSPLDFDDLPDEMSAKLATQHDVLDLTEFIDDLERLVGPQPAPAREFTLPDVMPELADELLVDQEWLQECVCLLRDRPQLILYGPPGTGKTYIAQHLAQHLAGGKPQNVKLVQFHPAYSYEDFFEGFRPVQTPDERGVVFKPLPGPLLRLVDAARQRPEEPFVLIIDEINRGNIAKIFGELYFLLEYRKKAIDLLYSSADESGTPFTLPENLVIIGTMNTADRSIALVDAAMRRRFAFVELHPEEKPTSDILHRWLVSRELPIEAARLLEELNARIEDRDFKIGPSYLMRPGIYRDAKGFDRVWRTQILPLLEEHHYGDGIDVAERYGLETLRRTLS